MPNANDLWCAMSDLCAEGDQWSSLGHSRSASIGLVRVVAVQGTVRADCKAIWNANVPCFRRTACGEDDAVRRKTRWNDGAHSAFNNQNFAGARRNAARFQGLYADRTRKSAAMAVLESGGRCSYGRFVMTWDRRGQFVCHEVSGLPEILRASASNGKSLGRPHAGGAN